MKKLDSLISNKKMVSNRGKRLLVLKLVVIIGAILRKPIKTSYKLARLDRI